MSSGPRPGASIASCTISVDMSRDQVSAPEFLRLLTEASKGLGTPLGADQASTEGLRCFCELMLKWNASLNITGAKTIEDLLVSHIPDTLVLAHFVPRDAAVVDVGSGGGLPALPLAVLRPDLQMTLIEPRAKRVAFLRTAVRELGLKRVSPWLGRVEDWVAPAPGPSVAMSRATFPPLEWLPAGMSVLAGRGRVYALLSEIWSDAELAGFTVTGRHHYTLKTGNARTLAWFDSGEPG